jgi:hypothetical protein
MEAREPFAIEKEITPMNMIREQNQRSRLLVPEISPYPTVVIVDMIQ